MLEEIQNVMISNDLTMEEKETTIQNNLLGKNIGYGNNLQSLLDKIEQYGITVPTGYPEIDEKLHGGFRVGISILAAPPGRGKSTMSLQLAEQISSSGVQTLYICNDMAEEELVSKSISRNSYQIAGNKGFCADEILGLKNQMKESPLFKAACDQFQKNAHMLRIETDKFSRSLHGIQSLLRIYGTYGTGEKMVVIIDYLQNITVEGASNVREQIDMLVRELKALAMEYQLVIIAISTVSRGFYDVALSMNSLKESGGIEYGADLVLALQYEGIGQSDFNEQDAVQGDIRDMELVVLKQRLGDIGKALPLKFYPKFNLFPYYDSTPRLPKTELRFPVKRK